MKISFSAEEARHYNRNSLEDLIRGQIKQACSHGEYHVCICVSKDIPTYILEEAAMALREEGYAVNLAPGDNPTIIVNWQ